MSKSLPYVFIHIHLHASHDCEEFTASTYSHQIYYAASNGSQRSHIWKICISIPKVKFQSNLLQLRKQFAYFCYLLRVQTKRI